MKNEKKDEIKDEILKQLKDVCGLLSEYNKQEQTNQSREFLDQAYGILIDGKSQNLSNTKTLMNAKTKLEFTIKVTNWQNHTKGKREYDLLILKDGIMFRAITFENRRECDEAIKKFESKVLEYIDG